MAAACRKIIAHQPQRVTLRKAEIRWVRWSEQEMAHLTNEEIETVELFRKFLGILNKLTPQKFKDLAEQALQLPINSPERLKGCIDMVFNKVCGDCILIMSMNPIESHVVSSYVRLLPFTNIHSLVENLVQVKEEFSGLD